MSRFVWILMLSGLFMNTGCEQQSATPMSGKVTSDDVRRDAGKAIDTATQLSQQTKKEFQKSLEDRLQKLDKEFDTLREKGSNLVGEAKANWEQKMAELDPKWKAARAKLAELGQSSTKAWKDIQRGAQSAWEESAWEDLDKALSEAATEFDTTAKPN